MKAQHPKPLPVTLKRIKPNENSSVVSDLMKHMYLVNQGAWLGVWTQALLCAWVQEGCQDAGVAKEEGELH